MLKNDPQCSRRASQMQTQRNQKATLARSKQQDLLIEPQASQFNYNPLYNGLQPGPNNTSSQLNYLGDDFMKQLDDSINADLEDDDDDEEEDRDESQRDDLALNGIYNFQDQNQNRIGMMQQQQQQHHSGRQFNQQPRQAIAKKRSQSIMSFDCNNANSSGSGGGGLFVEYQQTNRVSPHGASGSSGLEALQSLSVANCDNETLEEQINLLVHGGDEETTEMNGFNAGGQHLMNQHQDEYQDFNQMVNGNSNSDPFLSMFFSSSTNTNNHYQLSTDVMQINQQHNSHQAQMNIEQPDLFQASSSSELLVVQASTKQQETNKTSQNNRKEKSPASSASCSSSSSISDKQQANGTKTKSNTKAKVKIRAKASSTKGTTLTNSDKSKTPTQAAKANKANAARKEAPTKQDQVKAAKRQTIKEQATITKENEQQTIPLKNTNKQLLPKKSTTTALNRSTTNSAKSAPGPNGGNSQEASQYDNHLNKAPYRQQLDNLRKKLRVDISPKVANAGQLCQDKSPGTVKAPQRLTCSLTPVAQQPQPERPTTAYISISSSNKMSQQQQQQFQHQRSLMVDHQQPNTIYLRTSSGGLIPVLSSGSSGPHAGAQLVSCSIASGMHPMNTAQSYQLTGGAQQHQQPQIIDQNNNSVPLGPTSIIFQHQQPQGSSNFMIENQNQQQATRHQIIQQQQPCVVIDHAQDNHGSSSVAAVNELLDLMDSEQQQPASMMSYVPGGLSGPIGKQQQVHNRTS